MPRYISLWSNSTKQWSGGIMRTTHIGIEESIKSIKMQLEYLFLEIADQRKEIPSPTSKVKRKPKRKPTESAD